LGATNRRHNYFAGAAAGVVWAGATGLVSEAGTTGVSAAFGASAAMFNFVMMIFLLLEVPTAG
jgi:uncharacterized membrane protein (UPF0136 family)